MPPEHSDPSAWYGGLITFTANPLSALPTEKEQGSDNTDVNSFRAVLLDTSSKLETMENTIPEKNFETKSRSKDHVSVNDTSAVPIPDVGTAVALPRPSVIPFGGTSLSLTEPAISLRAHDTTVEFQIAENNITKVRRATQVKFVSELRRGKISQMKDFHGFLTYMTPEKMEETVYFLITSIIGDGKAAKVGDEVEFYMKLNTQAQKYNAFDVKIVRYFDLIKGKKRKEKEGVWDVDVDVECCVYSNEILLPYFSISSILFVNHLPR